MKKTVILALVIALASSVFAGRQNFKDRSDNWLQENSGGLRGFPPTINDDDPGDDPVLPGSVGGGLAVLFALSGSYMLRKNRK